MSVDKILELTFKEILENIEEGKLTKSEVYDAYHENILKKDEDIHAYIAVADKKDAIPIAVKDNINVAGEKMTAASKLLEDYVSPYDATVISKLKEHGVESNGKVNLDEFAMGYSTEYSAHMTTLNPVDLSRISGGSSGGTAAAVKAGFAPIALGTDTGGSIRQPSNYCGVVGFKPSYGMLSRYGVTAFSSSLDQVGISSKTVEDAAILMDMMQGSDGYDTTAIDKVDYSFAEGIDKPLENIKVGVIDNFIRERMQDEVIEALENTKDIFKSLGSTVEDIDFKYGEEAVSVYHVISSAELSSNLSRMDGVRYGKRADNVKNLEELYVKTRSEGLGPEAKRRIMLGTYVLSAGFYDAYYKKALKVRELIKNEMDKLFKEYDVILMPVNPKVAPKLGAIHNDHEETFYSDLYTCLANIAGLPAISVPGHEDKDGLPIGIQLMSNRYEDKKLLNIAHNIFKKIND